MHISFGSRAEFQISQQFPVDHIVHQILPNLFGASLLHSLIMWLILSSLSLSLSPHNLLLLSVTYYWFWSLWRCFILLLEEIQFLSWNFHFLPMSKFFRVQFRPFVAWNIHTIVFLPIFIAFLPVLLLRMEFLAALISLSLLFLMQSSSCCIDASAQSSMLVNPLPLSFLNKQKSIKTFVHSHQLSCSLLHLFELLPCLF